MLSDEERKAHKKALAKTYYIKNREKINAHNKLYNLKNPEKIKITTKLYRENNPEKYKKYHIIKDWKRNGLICDDYDKLYELYLESTNCEECDCKYSIKGDGVGRFRCMDHDHLTGLFRNFLCCKCNLRRG